MSTEPQLLSFKGLKQYTPEDGWGQVNSILPAKINPAKVNRGKAGNEGLTVIW